MKVDDEWARILARLLDDRPRLVEDFLERLNSSGIYGELTLGAADLRRAASDTLELLIRRLAGLPIYPALAAAPEALGIRRARQGVAQDALMEAVRLDFRVLWGGLARASVDSSADVLVRHAEEVLSTVERYIGEVQTAFLAESAALVHDERAENRRSLLRLLSANSDDLATVADEVAGSLGIPPDDPLELVVVPRASSKSARRLVEASHRQNDYLSADMDDGTVFIRRHTVGRQSLAMTLRSCSGALVPTVLGVSSIPGSLRLAERMATYAPVDHLIQECDAWLHLAHIEVYEKLPLLSQIRERLDALAPGDRARFVETIATFCATGSIKITAERLYCHRNTVVNRLRQITELTSCDLTVPTEAAQLLLALGGEAGRLSIG